jgi:hypothetical protein
MAGLYAQVLNAVATHLLPFGLSYLQMNEMTAAGQAMHLTFFAIFVYVPLNARNQQQYTCHPRMCKLTALRTHCMGW